MVLIRIRFKTGGGGDWKIHKFHRIVESKLSYLMFRTLFLEPHKAAEFCICCFYSFANRK